MLGVRDRDLTVNLLHYVSIKPPNAVLVYISASMAFEKIAQPATCRHLNSVDAGSEEVDTDS